MNIYTHLKSLEEHSTNNHYYNRYCQFILSRPKRILSKDLYTENHHIHPKCYSNDDSESNMIRLTAREHFIAHWMLWKACGGKMATAFWNMRNCNDEKINSKTYKSLREDFSKIVSSVHKGKIVSKETREKLRVANIGKKLSECTKEKIRISSTGRLHTDETKEKIRISHIGKTASEETRKKISDTSKGRKHSKESKEKIRISHIGKTASEETRKKISDTSKGRKHSKESKEKMSKSRIGKNNPMYGKSPTVKGSKWYCHPKKKSRMLFENDPVIKIEGWTLGRKYKGT